LRLEGCPPETGIRRAVRCKGWRGADETSKGTAPSKGERMRGEKTRGVGRSKPKQLRKVIHVKKKNTRKKKSSQRLVAQEGKGKGCKEGKKRKFGQQLPQRTLPGGWKTGTFGWGRRVGRESKKQKETKDTSKKRWSQVFF